MLNELKNLPIDRMEMEQLVALLVFGESLVAGFEANEVDVPEWLKDRVKLLGRQVRDKNEDALRARLRQAQNKLNAMQPEAAKRKALAAEVAALEKKLGA